MARKERLSFAEKMIFGKRKAAFLWGTFFWAFLAFIAISYFVWNKGNGTFVPLNRHWTLSMGDTVLREVDISCSKLPRHIARGDTLILSGVLPTDLKPRFALRIQTSLSAVSVSVDGKQLYAYGMDALRDGKMVGSGLHEVYLSPDAAGKDIVIETIATEDNAFGNPPVVRLYPDQKVAFSNGREHLPTFFFGLFLTLSGIATVLVCLCLVGFYKSLYRLLLIGMLSSFLGVWTLCYTKLLQLFSADLTRNSVIEYVTLIVSSLVMELLLLDMRRGKIARWKYRGLWILFFLGVAFFCTATALHLSGIARFPVTLPVFHLYSAIGLLYIFFEVLPDRKESVSERILSAGIAAFVIICAFELVRFNIQQTLSLGGSFWNVTFIPFALLLLFISLVTSFAFYMRAVVGERMEKDVLTRMAYRDFLTGLYNRAKSDQIFSVLEKENTDYAVVSIDMNGLKHANDRFGHAMGDRQIVAFAGALVKSFEGVGTTLRMGGDEFMVIVRAEHFGDLENSFEKLKRMESVSGENMPIAFSASYGVAFRSECAGKSADEVCRVADSRMYQMKEATKQVRTN